VRQHYENDGVSVNAFASHDSTRQVIEELPGDGTSGPYLLGNRDLIEHSEQVEIITRDRNQPGLIIKSVPMQRFADYKLEPFSGRLLFRAPIMSYQADRNQDFVRVTENVSVGVVDIEDRDPTDTASLRGANATVKLGTATPVRLNGRLAAH
jgi:hypothetical protein